MPVHLNGYIADMVRIMEIAQKYNLVVVEDACQSLGAGMVEEKAEVRKQKAEGRKQKAESRRRKAENRNQKREGGGQKSEVRSR